MNKIITLIITLNLMTFCHSQNIENKGLFNNHKEMAKNEHKDLEIKYNLSDSNKDKLIELEIGEINLPTGKIIACDPFFTNIVQPFSRCVAPGRYPVMIYIMEIEKEHYRVAFAKIKFQNEKATNWILAVSDDMNLEELTNLKEDEYFGFPVDAGLACFLDVSTNQIYSKKLNNYYANQPDANYYDDFLAKEFKEYSSLNKYSSDFGDWNNHIVDKDKDLNVIMFSSGWGDGYYPTFWGYNDNRETVELTVDFLINFDEE